MAGRHSCVEARNHDAGAIGLYFAECDDTSGSSSCMSVLVRAPLGNAHGGTSRKHHSIFLAPKKSATACEAGGRAVDLQIYIALAPSVGATASKLRGKERRQLGETGTSPLILMKMPSMGVDGITSPPPRGRRAMPAARRIDWRRVIEAMTQQQARL